MRALLGVSDRDGLVEFARALRELGVELVATDGTRRALAEAGVEARAVADVTGLPEMLDGRVKTLHPAIAAGILARRDRADHLAALEEHGFPAIDLVVVNLYPFAETVASGAERAAVIEKIDIGGPTLIRAAAKNSDAVAVAVSPAQYAGILEDLRASGAVSAARRRTLAAEAFAMVAAYDTAVAAYLAAASPVTGDSDGAGTNSTMPEWLTTGGRRLRTLRYGENPHQRGALYAIAGPPAGVGGAQLIQGAELSFTNWLDVDAARRLVDAFEEPAAAVIKHTNPCGFATGPGLSAAYSRAHDCDPRAAFGGVVGLNREIDQETAARLVQTFLEAVVAPGVDQAARSVLAGKQRLRVLLVPGRVSGGFDVRSVDGGLLVQTADEVALDRSRMRVMTARQPSEDEWAEMLIAWRVCRNVKSNAVVVVRDRMAVGVGAGQMSRVEAAELAVARAGERASGAVAASDAFFPMADGLETLARAGVSAVIQPGGSVKDPDVTAAADRWELTMVATGERHFRH